MNELPWLMIEKSDAPDGLVTGRSWQEFGRGHQDGDLLVLFVGCLSCSNGAWERLLTERAPQWLRHVACDDVGAYRV